MSAALCSERKRGVLTESGYRLYDDDALRTLQQILFFKELGFQLKEIDEILKDPDFDRIAAFRKQKELFLLKRRRMDRLIQLLDRLEKGEQDMSFKEFDMTDYINALENFKTSQTETVIKHWGSIENFDLFIQKIRDDEGHVARLAVQQFFFGSTMHNSIICISFKRASSLLHIHASSDKNVAELVAEQRNR